MKKCFAYIRVSTVKQGEGVSLEAQRDAIEQYATRNEITITRWFEEKETAAKSGRPVFGAMLRLLRRHQADGVVMHKIDRSARNFADWAKVVDLADIGIDVHFATESLDFRSRGGRLAADIQAVIAADYIRNLREETIKGLTGRLRQGLYPFKAPIGYLDNGKGKPKTIDPVRGPLVRQIFDLYAAGGHSFLSLQAEMKRRGLANRRGRALTKGGIEKVLRNPFYFGLLRIGTTGDTYPGVHEPLITSSLFESVQAVRLGKAGKKVTRHRFAYRGLFRCASCGMTMTAERQRGHVYYRCHRTDCPTRCVREEVITEAVVAALSQARFDEAVIAQLALGAERFARIGRERTGALRLRLNQVDARLQRLADTFIDEMIDPRTYQSRRETLLTERIRIEEDIRNEEAADRQAINPQRFFEHINTLPNLFISADPEERREIVEIATSNRVIGLKNVCLEPANWLADIQKVASAYIGDPYRPTFRRHPQSSDNQITTLMDTFRSDGFVRISKVLNRYLY